MNRLTFLFSLTFLLLSSLSILAQEKPCSDASDLRSWKTTVLMNYQSAKPEDKKIAADAGHSYVSKVGKCGIKDDFAVWINSHIGEWDKNSTPTRSVITTDSTYDAELARKLGADERGMKMYVLCILKTGPNDSNFKGKERDDIF